MEQSPEAGPYFADLSFRNFRGGLLTILPTTRYALAATAMTHRVLVRPVSRP
jgi:hypothetical protein